MTDIKVNLDFACCSCGSPVGVTVMCSGKGLEEGPHTVAAVKIPCPACCDILDLYFEPCGTVRRVASQPRCRRLLEPSWN
jgi:hypothetical protein